MGSLPESEKLPLYFETRFCGILFQKNPDHVAKKRMLYDADHLTFALQAVLEEGYSNCIMYLIPLFVTEFKGEYQLTVSNQVPHQS